MSDFALLIARVVLGLGLAVHGAQKLFGWFGGYGLAGTGGFFESLGFRPGRAFAVAAGLGEFAGGLLTALGLFGPVGPALAVSVMVVAMLTVHLRNGFLSSNNGVELPLLYAAAAIPLGVVGPGSFSADSLLNIGGIWTPELAWLAIGIGVIGGALNLALRHPAPEAAESVSR